MLLDARYSTEYYLRVVELAIRDNSRTLVYNRKKNLLEAWPLESPLSLDHDNREDVMQRVIQELFSRSVISYSLSGRLLSIIDMRLRQESPHASFVYKLFFKEAFTVKQSVINKLLFLKNIIFLERQRPLNKISNAVGGVFRQDRKNFSSLEDFTHQISLPHAEQTFFDVSLKEKVATESSSSQVVMEALMTFLESQTTYLPLSLELLDQFLSEKALSWQMLPKKSSFVLSELRDLYPTSREDFQAVINGIITESLSDVLTSALVGSQLLTSQGKMTATLWQEATRASREEIVMAQGFLAEILRHVISENLEDLVTTTNDATPEQIGKMYSIRDCSPGLWLKMMRLLLSRWLLDFDDRVYAVLKDQLHRYKQRLPLRQRLKKQIKKIIFFLRKERGFFGKK